VLELHDIDLRHDGAARSYSKQETVQVTFAQAPGRVQSSVGANSYLAGDALVRGADGDSWCVSRERFELAYEPLAPTAAGQPGRYRNRARTVLAKQMRMAFRCLRVAGGDWLQGRSGDWLLQYAPGDLGVATAERFDLVYRLQDAAT